MRYVIKNTFQIFNDIEFFFKEIVLIEICTYLHNKSAYNITFLHCK